MKSLVNFRYNYVIITEKIHASSIGHRLHMRRGIKLAMVKISDETSMKCAPYILLMKFIHERTLGDF